MHINYGNKRHVLEKVDAVRVGEERVQQIVNEMFDMLVKMYRLNPDEADTIYSGTGDVMVIGHIEDGSVDIEVCHPDRRVFISLEETD